MATNQNSTTEPQDNMEFNPRPNTEDIPVDVIQHNLQVKKTLREGDVVVFQRAQDGTSEDVATFKGNYGKVLPKGASQEVDFMEYAGNSKAKRLMNVGPPMTAENFAEHNPQFNPHGFQPQPTSFANQPSRRGNPSPYSTSPFPDKG